MVYIREAHPSDGWQVGANRSEGIIFEQPATSDGRKAVAESCRLGLDISIPMLLDGMDNAVEKAYAAWPDRLYIVTADGLIGYKGEVGPGGFNPRQMERALTEILQNMKD